MDSHQIRNSRWTQAYHLKKLNFTIKGYSRAAFRTGFYIHELGIMLDAGPQNFNKPDHIFITHTHGDHVAELPFTLIGDESGNHIFNIYGPKGSGKHVSNYIQSMFDMNIMGQVPIKTGEWYRYIEVSDPQDLHLDLKNNDIRIRVIDCDHAIPTVSYVFRTIKSKLKPEYLKLPGREIASLRKSGVEVTHPVEKHLFAYVCDCSIETVMKYEDELVKCPYIIIECTFLMEDEVENAISTKHIHWSQLEPFVAKYPEVDWILIHFSLRYRDSEIRDFFAEPQSKYSNLMIWTGDE